MLRTLISFRRDNSKNRRKLNNAVSGTLLAIQVSGFSFNQVNDVAQEYNLTDREAYEELRKDRRNGTLTHDKLAIHCKKLFGLDPKVLEGLMLRLESKDDCSQRLDQLCRDAASNKYPEKAFDIAASNCRKSETAKILEDRRRFEAVRILAGRRSVPGRICAQNLISEHTICGYKWPINAWNDRPTAFQSLWLRGVLPKYLRMLSNKDTQEAGWEELERVGLSFGNRAKKSITEAIHQDEPLVRRPQEIHLMFTVDAMRQTMRDWTEEWAKSAAQQFGKGVKCIVEPGHANAKLFGAIGDNSRSADEHMGAEASSTLGDELFASVTDDKAVKLKNAKVVLKALENGLEKMQGDHHVWDCGVYDWIKKNLRFPPLRTFCVDTDPREISLVKSYLAWYCRATLLAEVQSTVGKYSTWCVKYYQEEVSRDNESDLDTTEYVKLRDAEREGAEEEFISSLKNTGLIFDHNLLADITHHLKNCSSRDCDEGCLDQHLFKVDAKRLTTSAETHITNALCDSVLSKIAKAIMIMEEM